LDDLDIADTLAKNVSRFLEAEIFEKAKDDNHTLILAQLVIHGREQDLPLNLFFPLRRDKLRPIGLTRGDRNLQG
jgi:hypothetical protein